MKGNQLTVRGMVIGVIGSVIITCSSMFIALKLSSLPWPIMFVALFSMLALKALGKTNLNEINVTHTAMSAGAMVAGGLAFTIPGIWMLDPGACQPSPAAGCYTGRSSPWADLYRSFPEIFH